MNEVKGASLDPGKMTIGNHCGYYWIQWERASLGRLLSEIPQIVLGHYLVNTSSDSDSLALSDAEKAAGWWSVGVLTYSPVISDVGSIHHEQFEEWLAFKTPTKVPSWEAVVNFCGLSLTDRSYDWIHAKLWGQLERFRPESFLAQGERLIFITRNAHLHEMARGKKLSIRD
jgi:hypothetical protein